MKHDGKGDGNKDWWYSTYIQKQMTNGYFMPNNTPNEENIQFQYQKMEDWLYLR